MQAQQGPGQSHLWRVLLQASGPAGHLLLQAGRKQPHQLRTMRHERRQGQAVAHGLAHRPDLQIRRQRHHRTGLCMQQPQLDDAPWRALLQHAHTALRKPDAWRTLCCGRFGHV